MSDSDIMLLQKRCERLTRALEIYADFLGILWEDSPDDLPAGIFRASITGTAHPQNIARRALAVSAGVEPDGEALK